MHVAQEYAPGVDPQHHFTVRNTSDVYPVCHSPEQWHHYTLCHCIVSVFCYCMKCVLEPTAWAGSICTLYICFTINNETVTDIVWHYYTHPHKHKHNPKNVFQDQQLMILIAGLRRNKQHSTARDSTLLFLERFPHWQKENVMCLLILLIWGAVLKKPKGWTCTIVFKNWFRKKNFLSLLCSRTCNIVLAFMDLKVACVKNGFKLRTLERQHWLLARKPPDVCTSSQSSQTG